MNARKILLIDITIAVIGETGSFIAYVIYVINMATDFFHEAKIP